MSSKQKMAIGIVVVIACWLIAMMLTRPSLEQQTDALFARIQYHIQEGDAGDLVDEIDDQYQLRTLWPEVSLLDQLWHDAQKQIQDHPGANADLPFRQKLRATLNQYRFLMRDSTPVVTYTIHSVGELVDNNTFDATVSFAITGMRPSVTITEHRFVLSTHGWLRPQAHIRSHDLMRLN